MVFHPKKYKNLPKKNKIPPIGAFLYFKGDFFFGGGGECRGNFVFFIFRGDFNMILKLNLREISSDLSTC